MEDPATIWKIIASVEATVIVSIVGWWIKSERPRIAAAFKENETELKGIIRTVLKALDRNSDYLRDWHDELHHNKASRTEFDFLADEHKGKK